MHGTIVAKEAVLKEHPWVAGSIARAYQTAKEQWLANLRSGKADSTSDRKYRALSKIVGDDPLPFGLVPQALEAVATGYLAPTASQEEHYSQLRWKARR